MWNFGQVVGVVCPACQSSEEHMEAEVNAVLSPGSETRLGDPKTEPDVAHAMTREIRGRIETVIEQLMSANPPSAEVPVIATRTTFEIGGVDVVQSVISGLPPEMRARFEGHRDILSRHARAVMAKKLQDGPGSRPNRPQS